MIYREGERVDRVFMILSGMAKVLSYLPNGRARIVRLHGFNEWLGLEGLLGQPYEHTAVAVDDVEVVYTPVSNLLRLEREQPRQYCEVLKQGYRHLAQADTWISEFSTGAIKPRVARLIDFLSGIEHGKSSDLVELLTVQEMADMLGVTPESVSRILAEFKRSKILRKAGEPPVESYRFDPRQLHQVAQR